jgi:N-hydroxyarylamine O-acetyltransferase
MSAVPDAWSVGLLDLDAYLKRIGYTGPTGPSEATLAGLYRAHLAAVRFENLDVFLRGGVDVSLEAIQDKVVYQGRGGYCYEHAQLFAAVLERLGFGVERLLARTGPDGPAARPRTHLTLRVRAGEGTWLADPGFGSSPPAPLSLPHPPSPPHPSPLPRPPALRREGPGGPQETDGWIYEVVPDTEHGEEVWKLREYQAGQWVTLHRWTDAVVQPVDVVLSNHYTATHPDSWFTWQPVIVKRTPDAIISLLGRTYTVTKAGHAKTRAELTDREFAGKLTGEFALPLTPEEVAAVVAAPTGHDRKPAVGVAPGT